MNQRHLDHDRLSPAAVDAIIRRGGWRDWVRLRRAVHSDAVIRDRIRRICDAALLDPEGAEGLQRLSFWQHYVRRIPASLG